MAEELRWDPSVSEESIGIGVVAGTVTLSGPAPSYAEKLAARRATERVAGVRTVVDEIIVAASAHHRRTDAAIARALALVLESHVQIPPSAIRVSVADGWVTLDGTVEWHYQRNAASEAVQTLAGVRGVSNLVVVHPSTFIAADVTRRIEEAFLRSVELDCKNIVVLVSDGQITLRGCVRSSAEREDAARAAWSAPGVREVVDRLVIGP